MLSANNDSLNAMPQFKLFEKQVEGQLLEQKMQFQQMAQARAMQMVMAQAVDPYVSLTPQQEAMMPEDFRKQRFANAEKAVPLGQRGEHLIAKDKESAQLFQKEDAQAAFNAIDNYKKLNALAKGFNKFTDVGKREEIQALLIPLVGQLRVPYTGPGVFTPEERKMVLQSLGDPTEYTDVLNINPKKLKNSIDLMKGFLKNKVRTAFMNPEQAWKAIDYSPSDNKALKERQQK
jgi:hypothetical protein